MTNTSDPAKTSPIAPVTKPDGGNTRSTVASPRPPFPEDSPDSSALALLPKEATTRRLLGAIRKEIHAWSPPSTLSMEETKRYRDMAVLARVVAGIDVVTKHALGLFLTQAKGRLRHGEYLAYIETVCGLSRRTASKYATVATVFPDIAQVRRLGFDACYQYSGAGLPELVLEKLRAVSSREEADAVIAEWRADEAITTAWDKILPDGKAVVIFGRPLALELALPPFVAEFRAWIAVQPVDQVRQKMDRYRAQLDHFQSGQAVVRVLRQETGEEPQPGAVPRPSPDKPAHQVFRTQSLAVRLSALVACEGLLLDEETRKLARDLDERLIALTKHLQAQQAQAESA